MWKEELKGWKKWEVVWLVISCLAIMGLSVYWKDSVMGIISATTGVACVVCTGKGKLSAYVFGIVNILLYAIISFQAKYYGEVMLNVIYYFPMQFCSTPIYTITLCAILGKGKLYDWLSIYNGTFCLFAGPK